MRKKLFKIDLKIMIIFILLCINLFMFFKFNCLKNEIKFLNQTIKEKEHYELVKKLRFFEDCQSSVDFSESYFPIKVFYKGEKYIVNFNASFLCQLFKMENQKYLSDVCVSSFVEFFYRNKDFSLGVNEKTINYIKIHYPFFLEYGEYEDLKKDFVGKSFEQLKEEYLEESEHGYHIKKLREKKLLAFLDYLYFKFGFNFIISGDYNPRVFIPKKCNKIFSKNNKNPLSPERGRGTCLFVEDFCRVFGEVGDYQVGAGSFY